MTSPSDASLILSSLEHAGERGGDLVASVYAKLFVARPELAPLFVMDADGAVRGEMLSRAFDAIIDFIGERAYAHNLVSAEATNHEGYLVPRAAFGAFFGFVRDAVREACGAHWTGATDDAWRRLLADLDTFIVG
jgi:hemoglobin-like flavoprotein